MMFVSNSANLSEQMVQAIRMCHTILHRHYQSEPGGGPRENPYGPRFQDERMIIFGGPGHPRDEAITLELITPKHSLTVIDHDPSAELGEFSSYNDDLLSTVFEHLTEVYEECVGSNVFPIHFGRVRKCPQYSLQKLSM